MDLRDLRYFAAIAQSGSMTAAAKSLHVSQPTLTVAMQNLEEQLKTTLFVRERSGVRLTATGEELLRHANDVFVMLERAEQLKFKGLLPEAVKQEITRLCIGKEMGQEAAEEKKS